MACPLCGSDASKVIYCGLPMRLCDSGDCNCTFGVWAWVAAYLPIATEDGEFAFMTYDGWYLPALWAWLKGDCDEQ
jgi:hypothetical protein